MEFGNVLWVVAEHDALAGKLFPFSRAIAGMSFWFAPGGNAHLSVGPLSNDQVSVEEIRRPTLRGIGNVRHVILCGGTVVGDGRWGKGWLQAFRVWAFGGVEGHGSLLRRSRLLWLVGISAGTPTTAAAGVGRLLLVLYLSGSGGAVRGLSGARATGVSAGRARGATLVVVVVGVFPQRPVRSGPGRGLHVHGVSVIATSGGGELVRPWGISSAGVHVHGDRGRRGRFVMRAVTVGVSYHASCTVLAGAVLCW